MRYVEPLSDARTKLADFFNILLERPGIQTLGWVSLAAGVFLLAIGIQRFFTIRTEIKRGQP